MKKIIIILITCLAITSCASLMGVDYNQRVKKLEIGMSKDKVVGIMGKYYSIESSFAEENGEVVEILLFYDPSTGSGDYLIHLVDGNLAVIERYRPPLAPIIQQTQTQTQTQK